MSLKYADDQSEGRPVGLDLVRSCLVANNGSCYANSTLNVPDGLGGSLECLVSDKADRRSAAIAAALCFAP